MRGSAVGSDRGLGVLGWVGWPRIRLALARWLVVASLVAGTGCVGTWVDATTVEAGWSGALETEACGSFLVAVVEIDGRGPYRLLLDTGVPRTLLSEALFDGVANNGTIVSVRSGNFVSVGRIPVRRRSMELIGAALGTDIDGILGYTAFGDLVIQHDFPRQRLVVGVADLTPGDVGVVPMAKGNRPYISGSIAGERENILLDTGFSGGLAVRGFSQQSFSDGPRVVGSRARTTGVHPVHAGRLRGDVTVGPLQFPTPVVRDAIGPNLIGSAVLNGLVLTLDRNNGLARIVRPDGTLPPPIETTPIVDLGWVLRPVEGAFRVDQVSPGSSAEKGGIRVGDLIVSIDGEPVSHGSCGGARVSGTRTYGVDRRGSRFEVTLTPEVLVG